jgi:hypothetical protein
VAGHPGPYFAPRQACCPARADGIALNQSLTVCQSQSTTVRCGREHNESGTVECAGKSRPVFLCRRGRVLVVVLFLFIVFRRSFGSFVWYSCHSVQTCVAMLVSFLYLFLPPPPPPLAVLRSQSVCVCSEIESQKIMCSTYVRCAYFIRV